MAAKKKPADGEEPKKGGKGKIIAIVAALAVGAGGYVYGSGSSSGAAAPATTTTLAPALELGPMVDLPAVNLNLKDKHYLRIAVSLALASDVLPEEAANFNAAVAKDLVVSTLSGLTVDELSTSEGRDKAKEALTKQIEAAYGEMVVGVFFTDFVTE